MNKNIFLVDLSKCLGFMTETDRAEALEYYRELFEEAGPENEQKVLMQLGSPTKVAVELHRSYDRSHEDTTGAARLLRGLFTGENDAEPDADESPAEEIPVVETLPKIEEVLKEISAMDGPETEEIPAEESVEAETSAAEDESAAEETPAESSEEPAPAEESAQTEPGTEDAPAEESAQTEPETEEAPEEKAPAADKSEPVFVDVPVPAGAPEKAEEKTAPEAEPLEKKRGMPGWAIALIMVFTCWFWIPIFVLLLSIAICVAVIPLSIGLALIGVAGYLVICAIWAIGMITDALLMLGAAAIALAVGIVLLWLGIWAMIKLIRLLLRGTAATYRGIFGLPKKERAK